MPGYAVFSAKHPTHRIMSSAVSSVVSKAATQASSPISVPAAGLRRCYSIWTIFFTFSKVDEAFPGLRLRVVLQCVSKGRRLPTFRLIT